MITPYVAALRNAMSLVAEQPRAIVLGQSVVAGGTAMSRTLEHLPEALRLELPVFENTQLGLSTGLALAGYLPLSVFPRWNFLLAATDQLVNHLDALPLYGNGFCPRVLVRVGVPTPRPLHPGWQHLGDYGAAFRMMLRTVKMVELTHWGQIVPEYQAAIEREGSTILVEYTGLYDE